MRTASLIALSVGLMMSASIVSAQTKAPSLTSSEITAPHNGANGNGKLAMDNMMPSMSGAAAGQAQPGGMGGMKDDKMSDPSSQSMSGGMGANNSPASGMMDDKTREMMKEHMRTMMGMGSSASGSSQSGPAGMAGMAVGAPQVDVTNRIEGRIAFLKAELQVTDAQLAAWNKFADGLRSSRSHLMQARSLLKAQGGTPDRLEQYERHLSERVEALRAARTAFAQLYAILNDAQKKTADDLVVPLIEAF